LPEEESVSTTAVQASNVGASGSTGRIDEKLEAIVLPVSDVERAYAFYLSLGWRVDANVTNGDFRLLQLTPPGSGCSIQFGTGLTPAAPGSAQGLYLVVADVAAARQELMEGGVSVSEIFHEGTLGDRFERTPNGRISGAAPGRSSYGSFATFNDPDGNGWLLQEITTRLPGRVDPGATSYTSANELADALRRAEKAHGAHEARTGESDPNWPDWYARYMVAEQTGAELPT